MIRTTSAVTLAAVLSPVSAPWASGDTWTVPGDYATIQQCIIDAASSGDECLVTPGTYYENLNMMGKAITLVGPVRSRYLWLSSAIVGSSVNKMLSSFFVRPSISRIFRALFLNSRRFMRWVC